MKFVGKFALVPIERYNQLIKSTENSTLKEEISSEQVGTGKQEIPTGNVIEKQTGNSHTDEDSLASESMTNNSITQTNNLDNKEQKVIDKDSNPIKKYPKPPPGIPNRKKRKNQRWLKLF